MSGVWPESAYAVNGRNMAESLGRNIKMAER